jgi:hypothetical protein
VVQNSRKWKRERAERKKGRRQRGEGEEGFARRRARVEIRPVARPRPRAKERRAMPARDLGWWGS